ncbi:hypothetical protein BDP55DRAFT_131796 [Colletotrichum godetiae]|uniref:Uncharacterized protein n=1 Tax=Colletotrichum godetiae TaxID=1209918 RepID=A0AAJ0AZM8_9PEZI|nr:uncharacterized protein BDP55DRAFT_131796 [Colletotrichum godetiae]KAK1700430.1 hypothetical protein BDP55DRAFT_131796 [Colletotrichum godetiae]
MSCLGPALLTVVRSTFGLALSVRRPRYFVEYGASRIIPSFFHSQALKQGNATKFNGQEVESGPSCQLKGNC